MRANDVEAEISVVLKWFLVHSANFSREWTKEVLYGDLIDCALPLNAHLNSRLGSDTHWENLVPGAPGGVGLAAESYMLPAPIWPFSSWPGASGLIPSCLEFHLFWVHAWSSGSWLCSVEKVLSKFKFQDARVSLIAGGMETQVQCHILSVRFVTRLQHCRNVTN